MKKITIGIIPFATLMSATIVGGLYFFTKWQEEKQRAVMWRKSFEKECDRCLDWRFLARDFAMENPEKWDQYMATVRK